MRKGLLLLPGLLWACTYVPEPTLDTAGGNSQLLKDLRHGRSLFLSKCSGCHALPRLDKYDDDQWVGQVDRMIGLKKVHLQPTERDYLLKFLKAMNDSNQLSQ